MAAGQVKLHLEPETELAVIPPVGAGAGAEISGAGSAYVAPSSPEPQETGLDSSPKATNGAGTGGKKGETDLPPAYLEYLSSLQKAWGDLPDLTITYEQLAYEVRVPVSTQEIPNLWTFFRDGLKSLNVFRDKSKETRLFEPLHASTGVVRPGELTLILAPPGHGKSVLLKALAGRMVREGTAIKGEVRWNGLTAAESKLQGQQLSKLTAFVEQGDVHFPMLTVRETFQFAADNSTADAALLGSPDFAARQAKKVELMLELLGLKECADTVVGNAMLRGVSGGQKKRTTLGEMMIGQARALFLDEISTGLDSSATFDIVSALKRWTRVMRGSATVALLQPAPEVYELFDNIILLREGHIVFSGTKAQLDAHLQSCNITPNPDVDFADWLVEFLTDPVAIWKRDVEARGRQSSMRSFRKSFREDHSGLNPPHTHGATNDMYGEGNALGINRNNLSVPRPQSGANKAPVAATKPSSVDDSAEVVFHVGSDDTDDPAVVRAASPIKPAAEEGMPKPASNSSLSQAAAAEGAPARRKGLGQVISSENVPLSTASLRKRYQDSAVYKDLLTEISARRSLGPANDAPARSAFTQHQFYSPLSRNTWYHTSANLRRQALVMGRSLPTFVIPRIGQAIFMGLVMGSLFYGLGTGPKDFSPRFGLILFGMIFMAFANMMEVPLASEFKLVVYKQVDAGMYSTLSYVFSVVLMQLPVAIAECFVFGTLLYFLAAFNWSAGSWFFFLLIMLMVNLSVGAIFRTIAYTVSNPDVAMNLAGPTTAIFLLFGGFLVTADKIPNFFIWLYYLSPFSWAVRSGALNEFHSDRYPRPIGDAYLHVWQVNKNDDYKWGGIGYLAGLFAFFVGTSAYVLISLRSWLTVGTRRDHNEGAISESEIDGAKADETHQVRIGAKTTSMAAAHEEARAQEDSNQLAFTRMDLSFQDLRYTVTVTEQDEDGKPRTYERALLQGINGYAKAGELTALMGSSGAGKTTLMDVIAGRKTSGKITGKILVNGHPQTFPTFNRLMGYCEQVDVHVGMHTVREAIDFSAKLRLPSDVTAEQRERFVTQILADLELTSLSNRIIGDANVEGLSPGELKRLTIGVELAANPTFLFLDEPTSGLDARAAMIVVRVIRKIAQRGRSVVCTIHQPSADLFDQFDRLLLLKSGGKEVYFGNVGEEGVDVVSYFMNADIDAKYYRPELPEKVNVASWMLDVIGAGTSAKGLIAPYDEVYKASELRKQNMETVTRLSTPDASVKPASFDTVYASTASAQFRHVLHRLFTVYWRDTSYNSVKFFLMGFLGIIFGLVYLKINDDDEAGMISKISVMYMSFGFMGVLQSSNALPVVFKLREVFYRERASNTFAPWIYSTTLGIVELPYLFICAFLFTLPLYFLVGFENSGTLFWKFVLVLFLGATFFCYMGQLFASLMPNIQVANMIQGLCFTFFFLFGGVFIQKGSMPIGWQWMYYIDPVPKGLIPLSLQQFYCSESRTDCPVVNSVQYGLVTKYDYVRNYLATGKGWEDYYLGWLVLEIVVIRSLVALIVQKVSHVKR